jgi:hypothetical protein
MQTRARRFRLPGIFTMCGIIISWIRNYISCKPAYYSVTISTTSRSSAKRDEADKRDLLEAAEFTKSQAFSYFDWDAHDWCGTRPKPNWPRPSAGLTDFVNVLFPAGVNVSGMNQNPDAVTIQAGNFRHTIEHFGSQKDTSFSSSRSWQDYLELILELPIWVISCMPVDIGILNEISVIQQGERLAEISRSLVEQRLTPQGFSGELVNLEVRH